MIQAPGANLRGRLGGNANIEATGATNAARDAAGKARSAGRSTAHTAKQKAADATAKAKSAAPSVQASGGGSASGGASASRQPHEFPPHGDSGTTLVMSQRRSLSGGRKGQRIHRLQSERPFRIGIVADQNFVVQMDRDLVTG